MGLVSVLWFSDKSWWAKVGGGAWSLVPYVVELLVVKDLSLTPCHTPFSKYPLGDWDTVMFCKMYGQLRDYC